MAPAVSVVLVNWNGRELSLRCLAALAQQTMRDFEIVLVDNGSTDGSVAAIRAAYPAVRVIEAGKNLGFAEGCNVGIDAARGAWIATLNNDTEVDPRWLEELHRTALASPSDVGVVQSRVLFMGEGEPLLNSTGVRLFASGVAEDRSVGRPDAEADKLDLEVFCATAGAALYRRAMLDELRLATGVFDRTFFMYFEDVDLGWRCRLAGWRAVFEPKAIVRHAFQASSKKRASTFIGLHLRRNRARMLLKNASWGFLARTAPRTLYQAIEVVALGGPREAVHFADALVSGVRQRREVARVTHARGSERRSVEERWVEPAPDSLRQELLYQLGKVFRRRPGV